MIAARRSRALLRDPVLSVVVVIGKIDFAGWGRWYRRASGLMMGWKVLLMHLRIEIEDESDGVPGRCELFAGAVPLASGFPAFAMASAQLELTR